DNGRNCQQYQWQGNHPWGFLGRTAVMVTMIAVVIRMRIMVMIIMGMRIEAFLAMEDQEVQAERIQRSHKHTDQCCVVSKACAPDVGSMRGFDDVFFGIETSEERRTNQCQRTDQECNPGNRHVLAQTTHLADVLFVVHTD